MPGRYSEAEIQKRKEADLIDIEDKLGKEGIDKLVEKVRRGKIVEEFMRNKALKEIIFGYITAGYKIKKSDILELARKNPVDSTAIAKASAIMEFSWGFVRHLKSIRNLGKTAEEQLPQSFKEESNV